jgi:hypothetical protein
MIPILRLEIQRATMRSTQSRRVRGGAKNSALHVDHFDGGIAVAFVGRPRAIG